MTSSGGGTRKVDVNKNCTNTDILQLGSSLFFPDGISKRGSFKDLDSCVLDFQKVPMPDGVTVGEVYELSKLSGIIRFYLSTTTLEGGNTVPQEIGTVTPSRSSTATQSVNMPTSTATQGVNRLSSTTTRENIDNDSLLLADIPSLGAQESAMTILFGPSQSTPSRESLDDTIPLTFGLQDMSDIVSPHSDLDILERAMEDIIPVYHDLQPPPPDEIFVHRGQVFQDMITYYTVRPPTFEYGTMRRIEIKMILPNGVEEAAEDRGGIFRDALTEFWNTFYLKCTLGEDILVPVLVHTMKQADWRAVAMVIYIGYKQEKYFPNRLAIPFIRYCIDGNAAISAGELVCTFMEFLAEIERITLKSALEDFDATYFDHALDTLSSHDVRKTPTKANIKDIIEEVAHKEIVQNPAYVADCWRPIFQTLISPILQDDIGCMFTALMPSVKKILGIMSYPEGMSPQQTETSSYLQRFIKSLNKSNQEKFLRFCTGNY
jgi:hypothetical protein